MFSLCRLQLLHHWFLGHHLQGLHSTWKIKKKKDIKLSEVLNTHIINKRTDLHYPASDLIGLWVLYQLLVDLLVSCSKNQSIKSRWITVCHCVRLCSPPPPPRSFWGYIERVSAIVNYLLYSPFRPLTPQQMCRQWGLKIHSHRICMYVYSMSQCVYVGEKK